MCDGEAVDIRRTKLLGLTWFVCPTAIRELFLPARTHYSKALKYFRNVAQPDYENVVKDAVCAVEAVAKVLFPDGGTTLGDVVKSITGNEWGKASKNNSQNL